MKVRLLSKYTIILLYSFLYVSCIYDQSDLPPISVKQVDESLTNIKQNINFSAAASKSIGTYTQLQNDYSVIWEGKDQHPTSPDKIGLFTEGLQNDVSNLKLWPLSSNKTSILDFDGELKWGDSNQTFYAYYPYTEGSSVNYVLGNLPNEYSQIRANSTEHIKHIDFLYAKSSLTEMPFNKRVTLEFNHLFSIVELSISGTFDENKADNLNLFFGKILTQIDIQLVNKQTRETLPIAGNFNIDLTTIKNLSDGSISLPQLTWHKPQKKITVFLPQITSPEAFVLNNTPKKIYFVIGNTEQQNLTDYSLEITYHISTSNGESIINGTTNFNTIKLNNIRKAINLKAGKYYSSNIDLQLYEASNCYMVYKPGDFAFYANRPGANNTNSNVTRHYKNIDVYGPTTVNPNTTIPGIKSVDWLWSDARNLNGNGVATQVDNALISDLYLSEQGVISFRKNDTSVYGNMIIAAFDKKPSDPDYSNRRILWTWHIWCPYGKPKITAIQSGVLNKTGSLVPPLETYQFLDRNLGAIMNASENPKYNSLNVGLYYQWGRKDPFVGGSYGGFDPSSWPSEKSFCVVNAKQSTKGTFKEVNITSSIGIPYTVANPTSFIYDGARYGWRGDLYYLGSSGYSSAEVGMWDKEKTLFDPCPYGYYLPNGNAFNWVIANTTTKRYTATGTGPYYFMRYNEYTDNLGNKLSFPLTGYIASNVPNAFSANNRTFVWTSSVSSGVGWNELMLLSNGEKINAPYASSYGDPVRCVKLPKH